MKFKSKISRYLILVLIIAWAGVIFMFSAQPGIKSAEQSETLTHFIVKIIDPNYTYETFYQVEYVLRKLAHMFIYFVLSGLIVLFSYHLSENNKKVFLFSVLIAVSYALTDELHQYFVPLRAARLYDIGFDAGGAVLGALFMIFMVKQFLKLKEKRGK